MNRRRTRSRPPGPVPLLQPRSDQARPSRTPTGIDRPDARTRCRAPGRGAPPPAAGPADRRCPASRNAQAQCLPVRRRLRASACRRPRCQAVTTVAIRAKRHRVLPSAAHYAGTRADRIPALHGRGGGEGCPRLQSSQRNLQPRWAERLSPSRSRPRRPDAPAAPPSQTPSASGPTGGPQRPSHPRPQAPGLLPAARTTGSTSDTTARRARRTCRSCRAGRRPAAAAAGAGTVGALRRYRFRPPAPSARQPLPPRQRARCAAARLATIPRCWPSASAPP